MRIHRSVSLAALAASLLSAACSDSGTVTGSGGGTPARVDVVAAPAAVGAAGSLAGAFTVKVVDSKGAPVPGIAVTFSATGAAVVSPSTGTTDGSGLATTQVALSTIVGAGTVRATASGVTTAATSAVSVVAGPTTKIVNNPKTLRFFSVGDTARISASAQDQFGNAAPSGAVTYSVVDGTLVSVDQAGLVRVLRQPGTTLVISTSSTRADTTTVTVLAAGASNCTGVATATPMNVGDVQTFTGTQYACLNGATSGAEFALVAFNNSTDATNPLTVSVTGTGLATPPSTIKLASTGTVALRSTIGSKASSSLPLLDLNFHLRLLAEANREFKGALPRARAARRSAVSRSITGSGTVSYSAIPAGAKQGDIITLNVSSDICSGAINHGLRVEAVGAKSIVLADTLNPSGGFTNADYQRIATRFDTLVYPLDVGAFGAPSDFDNNGKVAILFTRTVNEMVDSTSGYFVGGFFNPRDLFPKVATTPSDNCAGSNEGEMFYMLVPAPAGINGVKHTTGFVDSLTTGIVAHEFQHLINAGHRVFNPSASEFEDVWLNEGLSHVAEELLYYRESGMTPRMNLTDSLIRIINRPTYGFWKSDAASNFSRFLQYLRDPGSNSPYADDDELPTRGATWSFLRYLADRLGPTDGTIWQRFDNSTVTGMATLQQVIGATPAPYFRDWAVANYIDDLGVNNDPRFMHPSWNFRDIYTNTFLNMPTYPLALISLTDGTRQDLAVRGGSASYLRFALPAGREGLLTFASGGGAPSTPFEFVVVRTK